MGHSFSSRWNSFGMRNRRPCHPTPRSDSYGARQSVYDISGVYTCIRAPDWRIHVSSTTTGTAWGMWQLRGSAIVIGQGRKVS